MLRRGCCEYIGLLNLNDSFFHKSAIKNQLKDRNSFCLPLHICENPFDFKKLLHLKYFLQLYINIKTVNEK